MASRQSVRRAATAVLACAAQFLVVLDVSLITVAVPTIAADIGLDDLQASWVISGYTVAFAALLLLGGRLCDLLGPRRAFLLASVVFVVATGVGALSTGPEMLIGARALQGAAAALLAPTSLALLQDVDEPRAKLRAVAAWSATSSAGGALGALLGGVLLLAWPWPAILLFEGALAVIGIALALVVIPRAPVMPSGRGVDVIGALALSTALAGGVVALIDAGTIGVTAPGFWVSSGLTVGGALVFALRHRASAERSLLAPVILRTPRIASANLLMLVAAASCFPLWFLLSLTLQRSLDLSALSTGLWFLVPSAGVVAGSLLVPTLRRRLSTAQTVIMAAGFVVVGAAGAAFWGDLLVGVVAPATVLAFGMGMMFTTLTSAATRDLPRGHGGAAAGAVNASRQVGGAIGLAVATVTFANTGGTPLGFTALAAVGLAVMLVACVLRRALRDQEQMSSVAPLERDASIST